MINRRYFFAGIALAAMFVAVHQGVRADAGHRGGFAFGKPGMAGEVTRTIHVDMRDMAYSIREIEVKEGETVRFVLVNSDEVEHDFTLGPPDLQARHRQEMAKMMDNDMDMSMHHKDPNAVFAMPGEKKELIWKFAAGHNLEFGCNVPGHYEAGMKGKIGVTHGH